MIRYDKYLRNIMSESVHTIQILESVSTEQHISDFLVFESIL